MIRVGAQALVPVAPVLLGAAWGLSQPFNKIAVTGGWGPWGIITWQAVAMVVAGGIVAVASGAGMPRGARARAICAMVATLGTLLPHWASYTAVRDLPAGVMAVVLAVTPMASLALATALGLDRPRARRLAGVALGASGVVAIALAGGIGPGALALAAIAVALIAPLCYALNGNLLDLTGRAGLDAAQVVLGAGALVLPVALGSALATGQARWPGLDPADLAMAATVTIHTLSYGGLVWLIGRAGAVFATLTTPFLTAFGVVWSIVILAETYPPLVWSGVALMIAGLVLVRPRPPCP